MALEVEKKLLTQIAKRNGGRLMVDDVLAEAESDSSPLHKHFEWDDTEAADQYRRQQARALIQRCRIQLVEAEPVQIRAFVSLPTDRENGGGYRLITEVAGDAYLKEEMMRDIRMTITRWTQKLHLLDQDLADKLLQIEEQLNRDTPPAQQRAAM